MELYNRSTKRYLITLNLFFVKFDRNSHRVITMHINEMIIFDFIHWIMTHTKFNCTNIVLTELQLFASLFFIFIF